MAFLPRPLGRPSAYQPVRACRVGRKAGSGQRRGRRIEETPSGLTNRGTGPQEAGPAKRSSQAERGGVVGWGGMSTGRGEVRAQPGAQALAGHGCGCSRGGLPGGGDTYAGGREEEVCVCRAWLVGRSQDSFPGLLLSLHSYHVRSLQWDAQQGRGSPHPHPGVPEEKVGSVVRGSWRRSHAQACEVPAPQTGKAWNT